MSELPTIERKLIEVYRIRSYLMQLHAVAERLPIYAAAGRGNYVKSAFIFSQWPLTLIWVHRFMNGLHVVSCKPWTGLGCDLVIDRTLIHSLKTAEGLTRGGGMSEHQWAVCTTSVPVTSPYSPSPNSTNWSIPPFRYVATIPGNGKLRARKTAQI